MNLFGLNSQFGKGCALIAATFLLPALAYADSDDNRGNDGGKNGHHHPTVPETNAGWVLVPLLGAVLFVASRQIARSKKEQGI